MQITSKGQVTIPQQVRLRLGCLPHTEVEFELAGDTPAFANPGQAVEAAPEGRQLFMPCAAALVPAYPPMKS